MSIWHGVLNVGLLDASLTSLRCSSDSLHPAILAVIFAQLLPLLSKAWGLQTSSGVPQHPLYLPNAARVNTFDWANLEKSRDFHFVSCYDDLQCARLDVPLNWNGTQDEKEEQRAVIAVVKVPAVVPVTHPNYGGAVLMNPGGPGESGIDLLKNAGRHYQQILDAGHRPPDHPIDGSADKYFDMISFDPRGVQFSTPHLACFPDAFKQQVWVWQISEYALFWDSDFAISLEWAKMESLGQTCAAARHGEANIMRYANTAQVVEDMLAIVDKHAQWRESEAKRLVLLANRSNPSAQLMEVLDRTAWHKDRELLQFWGMSYGSILGQTFAAMHPDRIKRLVIDGIVDSDDYYHGTWLANIADADKVMGKLCQYCFEAGPARCAISANASSPHDLLQQVEALVFGLQETPIAVPGLTSDMRGPEVVTFGDVVLRGMGAIAFPFTGAETFFEMLEELSHGNATRIATQKQSAINPLVLSKDCHRDGPYSDACVTDHYFGLLGSTPAIECMDSARSRNSAGEGFGRREFDEYLHILKNQSKWFSTSWARHRMSCVGIVQPPVWTFEGNISSNTSHPMLIIGNTYDSQTPIRNAHHASTLFPGSIVLQQNSEGHCFRSNPSLCTAKLLRKYFQSGDLPRRETICEPEWRPFVGCVHKDAQEPDGCRRRNSEDEQLWAALQGIAR